MSSCELKVGSRKGPYRRGVQLVELNGTRLREKIPVEFALRRPRSQGLSLEIQHGGEVGAILDCLAHSP